MANFNSVAVVIYEQNQDNPIVLSFGSAVGHRPVLIGTGVAVLTLPNPLAPADWNGTFLNRAASALPFTVRIGGTVAAPGAGSVQIDLVLGNSGLAPACATTGAVRIQPSSQQNDNWLIEIEALWDPTSTNVRGIQYGWFSNTAIAQSALITNTAANLASLQFSIGVTMLNANAANAVTVTVFDGEWL